MNVFFVDASFLCVACLGEGDIAVTSYSRPRKTLASRMRDMNSAPGYSTRLRGLRPQMVKPHLMEILGLMTLLGIKRDYKPTMPEAGQGRDSRCQGCRRLLYRLGNRRGSTRCGFTCSAIRLSAIANACCNLCWLALWFFYASDPGMGVGQQCGGQRRSRRGNREPGKSFGASQALARNRQGADLT
jgi:hypothetical protein